MKKGLCFIAIGIMTTMVTGCGNDKLSCTYDDIGSIITNVNTMGVDINFKDGKASNAKTYIIFNDKDAAAEYYKDIQELSEDDESEYKLNNKTITVKLTDDELEGYKGKTRDEIKTTLTDSGYTCK